MCPIKTRFVLEVISDSANLVAAGGLYSMVSTQDGSIWATGSNVYGQFGDGSTTSRNNFVTRKPLDNRTWRNDT